MSVMWAQPVFPASWLTEMGESGMPDLFGKHSETFLKHNTKQNTPKQKRQQRQPSAANKSQDSEMRSRHAPKCIPLAPLLELSGALYKSIGILFMRIQMTHSLILSETLHVDGLQVLIKREGTTTRVSGTGD